MKTLKHILFLALIEVTGINAIAQQDPIYAQYLNNPLTINPAYAGNNNMFNASLQYRTQWAGIDANPVTVNFSSHTSLYRNKVGVGLMVVEDKLGDTNNTEFNMMYSYKIQINDSYLSFGLQTGFVRYKTDPSMLAIRDAGDQSFTELTETKFNTGAGVVLKNDRYMIGFSAPRLLPATVNQGGQQIELYKQHYYLFGSYVMFLSEDIRFKPSVLLRGTQSSYSVDLNASFNIREFYTAGIFTRNLATYGFLVQAMVSKVRLGYVFELPGGSTSTLNYASHELMIGISMGLLSQHEKVVKTF